MTSETLARQIETYSNAIVAFNVLQGLAYAYAFGTDVFFNCLVKTSNYLAEGLTLMFTVVALLSIAATMALGRTLQRLAGEHGSLVGKLYAGKLVAVILFSLVPLVLTVAYGVRNYPEKEECKKIAFRPA